MTDKEKIEKLSKQLSYMLRFADHKRWCLHRTSSYTGDCDCGVKSAKAYTERLLREVEV